MKNVRNILGGMTELPRRYIIVTDYGEVPAPDDLIALFRKAPKVRTVRRSWDDGSPYDVEVVDFRTDAGQAYYKREREVVAEVTAKLRAEYEAAK
jgi:hypothetical protein